MKYLKHIFEKSITKIDEIDDILIYLTDVGLEIDKKEVRWFVGNGYNNYSSKYSFYNNFKSRTLGSKKSFMFSLSMSVLEEDQTSKIKEVMESMDQVKPRLEDYGEVYIKYHINSGKIDTEYVKEYDRLFINVNIIMITDEISKGSPVDEAATMLRKFTKRKIESIPEYGILKVIYERGSCVGDSQIEEEYSKIISILDKNFNIKFDAFYNNRILQFYVSDLGFEIGE